MSEEQDSIQSEFAELVEALCGGGMRFLLVGGLSLLAHHVERATGDIDFFCEATAKGQVAGILLGLGYSVMHENPALFVRYHKSGRRVVDFIFVGEDTYRQLEAASFEAEISGVRVSVPCLDHLLAMKLFSVSQSPSRGKDLGDILSLVANNGVDVHSPAFEALCLKYASPKWLNLIRELA
jgi:hypothetical protein